MPESARHLPHVHSVLACLLAGTLTGCAVGPDYQRPAITTPGAFKEARPLSESAAAALTPAVTLADAGMWQPAQPADLAPRSAWWTVFGSSELNGLMDQLNAGNFTIQQYEAQYRQAQGLVQQAQGGLFPTWGLTGGGTRSHSAANGTANSFSVGLGASWAPDLWGSVRRTIEMDQAKAQASAAQLAGMRLSMQTQLATAYLQLVVLDAQIAQTRQLTKGLADLLKLTRNQYHAGTVASDVVANAQNQLSAQEAALAARELSRAQLEHAIAALIGLPPVQLSLPNTHPPLALPQIPAGLPSTLLQRRPDIAAAERSMAAANAQIGVAQAAYFPNITLSGSAGFAGSALGGLLTAPHRVWSLGLALAGTLLDGGQRSAQVTQARAGYDASVASYRQTVVTALQGVEDQLAAQRLLAEQAAHNSTALAAARKAERVATNQYKAGMASYLNVITAQNSRITAENTLWTVRSSQYTAAVALINALGGGWETPAVQGVSAPGTVP